MLAKNDRVEKDVCKRRMDDILWRRGFTAIQMDIYATVASLSDL